METIQLKTWEDFAGAIQSVRKRYGSYPDPVAAKTGNA
jgi:hypothetical protein